MKDHTGKFFSEKYSSSHPDYPLNQYFGICDFGKFQDFKYFVSMVNKRSEWLRGYIDEYDPTEYALNPNVEYFHPVITYDDRMLYIMENIVSLPNNELSLYNKIGNTIISHFYGARGIHSIATREDDPKKAHVNFEIYFKDAEYRNFVRNNLLLAQRAKLPIYGSTELRSSLFGAANSLHRKNHGSKEENHPGNIMDWVASIGNAGLFLKMMESKSAEEVYNLLTSFAGIGAYYGYHCTTSNSVNPDLNWTNDSNFVKPGPGAQYTLGLLFPGATKKQIASGDLVIWFRHNQKFFGFDEIIIHENARNVLNNSGKKILPVDQVEMTTYGSEVALCQYGIFCKLRNDKAACDRRKVARSEGIVISEALNNAERKKSQEEKRGSLSEFL